jgi:MFS family permease
VTEAPPPGFGRVLAALIAAQLGLHSAMAGLRMAAPLQVLRDGGSPFLAGVVLALFALAPTLLVLPAGRMADRHGYHRPMRWAAVFSFGGGALAVLSTVAPPGALRLALLCAAACLCGGGTNIGLIAIQRSASRLAESSVQRVRVFSWLGMAPSLSNVVGPVLVGLAIDAAGFAAAYGVVLALPLVSVLMSRRVPPELTAPAQATGAPRRRGGAWGLLRLPGMKRLLLANWLVAAAWDVHTFAVPVIGHERGFAASTIGFVLGCFTAAVTLVRFLIPWLAHRVRELSVLRAAMVWTGAVLAVYPWVTQAWQMAGLALLLGLSLGSVQPMVMSALHHLTPEHSHGEAIALRSLVLNASSALLPLAFGAAGAALGLGWLFWGVAAAVAGGQGLAKGLRLPQA